MNLRTTLAATGLFFALIPGLALAYSAGREGDDSRRVEVRLTKEEAHVLYRVFSKDKFLRELADSQKGLSALNQVANKLAVGPVKLVLQWNQSTIDAWGKANNSLREIGRRRICDDLMEPIIDNSENQNFFEDMRRARGC